MPMFIYHYMILNIIVNVPEGEDVCFPFLIINVTICYSWCAGCGLFFHRENLFGYARV